MRCPGSCRRNGLPGGLDAALPEVVLLVRMMSPSELNTPPPSLHYGADAVLFETILLVSARTPRAM
ncbi:MAG TPA: hypothetical protein VKB96_17795 [Gammaproteobacteria bacterium]|nr:hypothetical protein [Gammaproteobacteria bacterium]